MRAADYYRADRSTGPATVTAVRTDGHPCYWCHRRFDAEKGAAIHMAKTHEPAGDHSRRSFDKKWRGREHQLVVPCTGCDRRFATIHGMHTHAGIAHDGAPTCPLGHENFRYGPSGRQCRECDRLRHHHSGEAA